MGQKVALGVGAGSSPRMRGAPRLGVLARPVQGIIPADAGSTTSCFAPLTFDQDHPRGCGEHTHSTSIVPVLTGSSPRMRGAH